MILQQHTFLPLDVLNDLISYLDGLDVGVIHPIRNQIVINLDYFANRLALFPENYLYQLIALSVY